MKWLPIRVLVLSLLLGVLCAVSIALGRLDPTPNPLQAVGFDTCGGEPCFRGIKPGMDWTEFQQKFPDAYRIIPGAFVLSTERAGPLRSVYISPSEYQKNIQAISIGTDNIDFDFEAPHLTFTVANLVAQYGPPCLVFTDFQSSSSLHRMVLIYPTMYATLGVDHLQWDTPSWELSIIADKPDLDRCDANKDEKTGIWHGFTSVEIYHRRNLAAIGKAEVKGKGS